jgi:uncharacterized protein YeaO (DUF488 family)
MRVSGPLPVGENLCPQAAGGSGPVHPLWKMFGPLSCRGHPDRDGRSFNRSFTVHPLLLLPRDVHRRRHQAGTGDRGESDGKNSPDLTRAYPGSTGLTFFPLQPTLRLKNMLKVKRVYDPRSEEDGTRVLVDRLWPRGVSKERAGIDLWMKEIAPSDELRRWFGHEPSRWEEFRARYRKELAAKKDLLGSLRKMSLDGTVTLVYAAKDPAHNNAVVVEEMVGE